MKLKSGLVLRKIAHHWVVLPLAAAKIDLNGVLKLNDTGAFLWEKLERGADKQSLVEELLRNYDIERSTAEADVQEFLAKLTTTGYLED